MSTNEAATKILKRKKIEIKANSNKQFALLVKKKIRLIEINCKSMFGVALYLLIPLFVYISFLRFFHES